MTFCNVAWNRDSSPPHLRRETESLVVWERGGDTVNVCDNIHAPLPDDQITIAVAQHVVIS
jgi:hypothetical protein